MKQFLSSIILISFLLSCSEQESSKTISTSKKETKKIIENNFSPEYPLIEFYVDDHSDDANITQKGFPEGVNDLLIDTTDGRLVITFEANVLVGVDWGGKVSPNFKAGKYDTVFLDYFINEKMIETNEKAEYRFYYLIADATSYERCVFMPRDITPKKIK